MYVTSVAERACRSSWMLAILQVNTLAVMSGLLAILFPVSRSGRNKFL